MEDNCLNDLVFYTFPVNGDVHQFLERLDSQDESGGVGGILQHCRSNR